MQNTAPISGLSETSSDHEDTESEHDIDVGIAERLFVTGVLDELKICFSYSYQVGLLAFCCISLKFEFPLELKMCPGVV